MISLRKKINTLNSYLLILLFLFIPFSAAITTVLSMSILLGWLISLNYKENFNELKSNKVLIASCAFVLLHFIGLLWSNDVNEGFNILRKEWRLLVIPIFMLYVEKRFISTYIFCFILAMSISEILSYGVWFEIIPPFLKATVLEPTPFLNHTVYNPLLAISIFLLSNNLLFNKDQLSFNKTIFYTICLISMTINMFITGGRSGQVMLFFAILILIIQYFHQQYLKAIFISLLVIPSIFILAYSTSHIFHQRTLLTIHSIIDYKNNQLTSTGERITFTINSLEIFSNHPLMGVGTGSFINEYRKINEKNSPHLRVPFQPHNMYILEMVQLGLLGVCSLLLIFYYQIKHAINNKNKQLSRIGVALPLLFFILNFGDSYLLGRETGLLFSVFSSFLYKKYE